LITGSLTTTVFFMVVAFLVCCVGIEAFASKTAFAISLA
jgi:hypothetical protein